jgi:hypothetical protein
MNLLPGDEQDLEENMDAFFEEDFEYWGLIVFFFIRCKIIATRVARVKEHLLVVDYRFLEEINNILICSLLV